MASPYFFAFCLGLVTAWLIGLPFAGPTNNLYHLMLNSPTTAITFLLVALQGNDANRFEKATNERLEKIIKVVCGEDPVQDDGQRSDSQRSDPH